MTIRDRFDQFVGDVPVVFGEPTTTPEGTTVITVARGGGFGRSARPLGVFVIHGGRARWEPVVDVTRIATLGEWIGLVTGVIATLAVLRRPPWPDLRRRE